MALLKANNIYFDSLGRVRIVSEASLNSMDFTFGYGLTNAAGFSANTRNFTFLTTNNDVVIDGYAARRDFELNFLGLNSNSQKFKFGQIRMAANSKTSGSELGHMSFTIFSNTEPTKGQSIVFDTTGLSPGTNSNAKSLGITRGWANVALESNGRIVFNSGAQEISFTHNNTTSAVDVKGTINFDREATVNGNPMFAGYGLLNVRYLTTGTDVTYTPTPGTRAMLIECVAGGGGGGSANGAGAGTAGAANGGGGGGYAVKFITDMDQTFVYTIGAGGAGGSSANPGEDDGDDGGYTYFNGGPIGLGTLVHAVPGSGGSFIKATAADRILYSGGGAGGGPGTYGDFFQVGGNGGGSWRGVGLGAYVNSGHGGDSAWGRGGASAECLASWCPGAAGVGYGGGGSGGAVNDTLSNAGGGAGAAGAIKVWEYA